MNYQLANRIIGSFMGYTVDKYGYTVKSEWKDEDGNQHYSSATRKHFDCHKDWNLLMTVVERIESIHDKHHGYFGVHISSNTCSIQGTNLWKSLKDPAYGAVYISDPNAVFNTKIESTWYACLSFTEWYTKNLKS